MIRLRMSLPVIDPTAPFVTCAGCGVCCMHMSVPPYDEEEQELLKENLPNVYADWLAVVESRKLQLAATGTDEIPCGFFDMVTRRCKHHAYNPDICHRFEVGGEFCVEQRQRAGLV